MPKNKSPCRVLTPDALAAADPRQPLTPRERDVLMLVVAGYSDKAIAATLGIARKTASNHVSSLLRKLGAETRAGVRRRVIADCLLDGTGPPTDAAPT